MRKIKRACAFIVAGTLISSMGVSGIGMSETAVEVLPGIMNSVKAADATGNVGESSMGEQAEDTVGAVVKEEEEDVDRSGNVYVEAEPDGTTKKITVSEGLEGSSLADELPVSVKVSYYLDGKKMSPDKMAGASGKVKIRFDYENLTSENVEIDGKNVEVQVPFIVISALILPTDTFTNIEVSDGKIIASDEQNIVAGIAFPGMSDSLRLQDYEPTEEVSIPNYVEVTADVTDFELELTASIVTPCGLSDMDTENFSDVDELVDGMEDLTDASAQLTDGIGELSDGINDFQTYLSAYTTGAGQVSEGAKALADGLAVMDTSKKNLVEGASALQKGLNSLKMALAQIHIPSGDEDELQKAANAALALKQDAAALADVLETIRNQFETAYSDLEKVDLSKLADEIDAEATRQAKEQAEQAKETAKIAVGNALADEAFSELTPEMKQQILEAVNAANTASLDNIQITGTTEDIQQKMEEVKQMLMNAADAVDISALMGLLSDMKTQMEALAAYSDQIAGLPQQVAYLNAALGELSGGVTQLESGSSQLVQGMTALGDGIGEASKGAAALSSGASELASAGSQLDSGFGALAEGAATLKEAMQTFDKEGMQELKKLTGDDLTEVITRFKAMKEAEIRYNDKAGLEEREIESIKFIVETEEITD